MHPFLQKGSRPLVIYVSSSVTNAHARYREFIRMFKQLLRDESSAVVLEWVAKGSPLGEDFFNRNASTVGAADVVVAFVDEPSIGVGMEIGSAIRSDKPLLCLYREGATVSRLLMSARESSRIEIESYTDAKEAMQKTLDFIERRTALAAK